VPGRRRVRESVSALCRAVRSSLQHLIYLGSSAKGEVN
jgi:hypothetical protein